MIIQAAEAVTPRTLYSQRKPEKPVSTLLALFTSLAAAENLLLNICTGPMAPSSVHLNKRGCGTQVICLCAGAEQSEVQGAE